MEFLATVHLITDRVTNVITLSTVRYLIQIEIQRDLKQSPSFLFLALSRFSCKFLCLFRRIEESANVNVSIKANHFDFFALLHLLFTHQKMWLFLSCNYQ